ncbi:unnamed protein product [Adineta steineri]|uniref:Uncharacterized protein n=1 Tax=Adineta steineri TaxID=433720 RepID=A0A815IW48_9BILA|nr:unnamed protein product [Adineta steineri]
MAKWALGYELIPNNDDSIEHNMGRILFLKTFDLDLKDVADAIEEENEQEDEQITKDDTLDLENLRQQVDDVLKKFATFDKRLTTGTHCYDQNTRKIHKNGTKWHVHKCLVCQCKDATSSCEVVC